VTTVGNHLVAPQQVVAALIEGDAVGVVAVELVVGHEVVDAVTVEYQAREFVVVAAVVEDKAVVHFPGNDDAVLLLGAMDGVVRDDQAVGTVVGVNAVDDVVFVGVALDHEARGLVAVEAVPHVRELGVDDPAGWLRTFEHLGHVRRVLGNTHPIRLAIGVAETGHLGVGDVGLGAAPGQQERAELLGRLEQRRAIGLLVPAGDFGITHKQLAVVDQERPGFLGQPQFLGVFVDIQDALAPDHDRQLGQEYPRRGFAQVLLGHFAEQVLEVHVAVVDKDRLGDTVLAHHPFGHLVVAADEVLEGVFLHHAADADFARFAAHDFLLDGGGGVARQIRQGRLGHFQRRGGRAGNGVGLGLLQFLGDGRRLGRRIGERCGAGHQHCRDE